MEKERWKVRLCVIIVTIVAIIVGFVYYLEFLRPDDLSKGMLISIMEDVGGERIYYDVE